MRKNTRRDGGKRGEKGKGMDEREAAGPSKKKKGNRTDERTNEGTGANPPCS